MKKRFLQVVLMTFCMLLLSLPLLANSSRIISEDEFTAQTGLAVEDVIGDDVSDITTSGITIEETRDGYFIYVDGQTYYLPKQ